MAEDQKSKLGAPIASVAKDTKLAKEIRKSKGLYNVEFEIDSGNNVAGTKATMHYSTARALEAHGVLKVGTKVTVVSKTSK